MLAAAYAQQPLIFERPFDHVLHELGGLGVVRTERLTDQADCLVTEHGARAEQNQTRRIGRVLNHAIEGGLVTGASSGGRARALPSASAAAGGSSGEGLSLNIESNSPSTITASNCGPVCLPTAKPESG